MVAEWVEALDAEGPESETWYAYQTLIGNMHWSLILHSKEAKDAFELLTSKLPKAS